MRTPVLIVLTAFISLASVSSYGTVTIAQMIGPDQSDITTPCPDVLLVKFSGELNPPPKAGDELMNGDELQCPKGTVTVVIKTDESSSVQVQLTGSFRAALSIDAAGKVEFIKLDLGSVHVIGDSTPAVKTGDTTFGPKGTHYTVGISDDPKSSGLNLVSLDVFDGEVEVSAPELKTSTFVAGYGTKISKSHAVISRARLTDSQIAKESLVQARIDSSRIVDPNKRNEAVARFSANYTRILTSPTDAKSRLALVNSQVLYGVTNPTSQYQLNQVRVHMGADQQIQLQEKVLRDQVKKQILVRPNFINPVKLNEKAVEIKDMAKAQQAVVQ